MRLRNKKYSKNLLANSWFDKQNRKTPKYFCANCFKLFRVGRFSRKDSFIYDDICPNCGAIGLTLEELADEYKDLVLEYKKHKKNIKKLKEN